MTVRYPYGLFGALALMASLALVESPALAQGGNSATPCERTAGSMFQACERDAKEELNLTLANCENIGSEAEENGEYEYDPVELTFDYFAQTAGGSGAADRSDIIYCGENTVEYEDGYPVSTDGSFMAGVEFAKAVTLLRGNPKVGDADRQEYALEEAEDVVAYLGVDVGLPQTFENGAFPCAGKCLQSVDLTALEPGEFEVKHYLPGTGFVLALPFELNGGGGLEWTGEREELVCQGGSLEVLEDSDCGIGDPEELLETLCSIAGDVYCAE